MENNRGTLQRNFPLGNAHLPSGWHIHTDACPWGIGGVLTFNFIPVRYFADYIHFCDLDRFSAVIREPGFNTLWEALAILVAIRAWRRYFGRNIIVGLRSDSLGSFLALRKRASRSAGLAIILRELALDEAELDSNSLSLTHIPGVANVRPDALSRIWAPVSKEIPIELLSAIRTRVPVRNSPFWRSCQDP